MYFLGCGRAGRSPSLTSTICDSMLCRLPRGAAPGAGFQHGMVLLDKVQNMGDLQHLLSEKSPSWYMPAEAVDFSGKRFLVVEDIAVNREIAAELLRDTGALVEFAENGHQCVDRVSAAPEWYYDLILMDINMPIMDGLEATKRIRQMGVKVPIVAMSANVSDQDRRAALDAGMDAFTEKPIFVEKLLSAISECLAK